MDFGNETVLKATGITKKYGAAKALDKVSIEIKRGMIYGLIGENGAGKSTFMRTIMGLISIDEGSIELFGTTDFQAARRRMGQSIETPALYPELTARDNLRIQAANGGVSDREIEDLLKMMRLENTGKKKAKNFSLGMRQRLAIANALITNPEFLILDEPTNGMDPAGMAEMREIIQRLVKERGITVLLSSHLLDELSQIATHYGILHEGHLIKELSKEELAQESRQFIKIDTSATEQAVTVLDSLGYRDYFVQSSRVIQLFEGIDQVAAINQALVEAKVPVDGIHLVGQKLEDYFLQLTGGKTHV
ncbi:TPA: ATP-binding cassette domain-containing protein [Enterococcus faecium]|uniref:ATP-binding cassette domain-containing protein n=1 Tax=Enterococcus faecium TaxID=1352 RepID=A0AB74CW12_ENTFC|nr:MULTISPECIES: ATP-binding cassette domain-containing protein [Enterococcus]EGP4987863.1 ATP-binding cassette domain-containing protein [Enterococcus faecium]EGP5230030.1 ATP-binding cassette domain-containing protein [Enterococcus faecium]EGP5256118.1 ATP-binding cassette domain-containing protein [Enterococcus faecium]EME7079991.1 ATP-binding cassette domain-containing protein [Enterococcus faecium]EME7143256.1 ATP-binding cassette domain-containing protein [Enterococcus faecium]